MADNGAAGEFTTEVPLGPNFRRAIKVNKPNRVIIWNQIPNVFAVRQDQQFAVRIRLRLIAPDGLRKPLATVPGEAEARHEREAAPLPRERLPWFHKRCGAA